MVPARGLGQERGVRVHVFCRFARGKTPTLVVSLCDQASTDKLVGVSPARNDKKHAHGLRALGPGHALSVIKLVVSLCDQVIREDPAGAVVVRAWPGHRNIGRGSCRSALADGVERRSTAVVLG